MTKFVCISDTHATENRLHYPIPDGDVLLFAGDVMTCGYREYEIVEFLNWFSALPHKHKIWIAGNHDRKFEYNPESVKELRDENSILLEKQGFISPIYLQDESVTIEGWKIYGSPWQPWFCDWAFNLPRDGEILDEKWAVIPDDTDILITHGPPFKILDNSPGVCHSVGCKLLMERVKRLKPKIHLFGHIHGGYGVHFDENINTYYVNASLVDERYEPVNAPIVIELYK